MRTRHNAYITSHARACEFHFPRARFAPLIGWLVPSRSEAFTRAFAGAFPWPRVPRASRECAVGLCGRTSSLATATLRSIDEKEDDDHERASEREQRLRYRAGSIGESMIAPRPAAIYVRIAFARTMQNIVPFIFTYRDEGAGGGEREREQGARSIDRSINRPYRRL
jgi:hypothetical protein